MPKFSITTRSYDNNRSGNNSNEIVLTPDAVGSRGIKRLFSYALPGDARGTEGAVLLLPELNMEDGVTHDVAFVATQANIVFAFDANNGDLLWATRVGNPINNVPRIDMYSINDHWGIISTPVIDQDFNTLYCVAWSSPDGDFANGAHYFIVIDCLTGGILNRIDLEQASYDSGISGLKEQEFISVARKQRAGLLLTNINGIKTVFIPCGSFNEDYENQGWVIAVDVTDPRGSYIATSWTTTARYSGAGIWQGGQGLAADTKGFLYGMTGNGAFDGITDFGESFIKLQYTPKSFMSSASLKCVDWISPFSDTGRVGGDPTLTDVSLIPDYGTDKDPAGQASNANGYNDMDLGSGGPLLVESMGMLIGAGKDGIGYVVNANNLGKTRPSDFAPNLINRNYTKFMSAPIWFTYYNPDQSPMPVDDMKLNMLYANRTHHQHSTPVYYNSEKHGPMVFTWGENGNLRAYNLSSTGTLTYLACSAEVASPNSSVPAGGMPGGMISATSNGRKDGIIWADVPWGDANKTVTAGRLIAYDADNFNTFKDGSKQLKVLWDSSQWNIAFSHNKFNIPHVVNGKVYNPTYDGTVDVYGLV